MKGFLTIATGDPHYYYLAHNLLLSYRAHTNTPMKWAIICNESNKYTKDFDIEIVSTEYKGSFLDKIRMITDSPFDETLFIDADCLAFGDLNRIWDSFKNTSEFSCFGSVTSLVSEDNWFDYAKIGDYQKSVSYGVGLHGGIYYFVKGEKTNLIYKTALELIPHYSEYGFKYGTQEKPWDESLLSLSMAINQCQPVPMDYSVIRCYWRYWNKLRMNIRKPLAWVNGKNDSTTLVHFGTKNTRKNDYKKQVLLLSAINRKMSPKEIMKIMKYSFLNVFDKDILYIKKQRIKDIFRY